MPDVPAQKTITEALERCAYRSPRYKATAVLDALKAARYVVVQLPEPGEFSYDSDDVWMNNDGYIVDAVGVGYGPPGDAAAFALALLAAAVSGANKTGAEGREEKP